MSVLRLYTTTSGFYQPSLPHRQACMPAVCRTLGLACMLAVGSTLGLACMPAVCSTLGLAYMSHLHPHSLEAGATWPRYHFPGRSFRGNWDPYIKDESVLQFLSFYPGQKQVVNSSLLYAISIFCTNHNLRTITKHLNK